MSTLQLLLEKGLPSREVQIANVTESKDTDLKQAYHDNLNLNANLQVDNTDVSETNPMPVLMITDILTTSVAIVAWDTAAANSYILQEYSRQLFVGRKYLVRILINYHIGTGPAVLFFMDSVTNATRTLDNCVLASYAPGYMGTSVKNEIIECGFTIENGLSVWGINYPYFKWYDELAIYDGSPLDGYPMPTAFSEGMIIVMVVEN